MERAFFIKTMGALSASGLLVSPGLIGSSGQHDQEIEIDWANIRKNFSYPGDYHYLNTAGIGAVPIFVRNRVSQYWEEQEVYPKPGHNLKEWSSVKKNIADIVGVQSYDHLALTNSTTEGINIVLNGLDLNPGDEIISSTHEHPALHVPLINVSRRKGVVIRFFKPDLKQASGNIDRIEQLISPKTRLIFLSMVTCTMGQLLPVNDIIELARKKGILVALDGAQTTGQVDINLDQIDPDFYTSGGQKWLLGPKRTGFLYVNPKSLDRLVPTTVGAYSEKKYTLDPVDLEWAVGSTRFEYATQNESIFQGLNVSLEFIRKLSMPEIEMHNHRLAEEFLTQLKDLPGYELFSPAEKEYRTSIISFGHKRMYYRDLASALMKKRFRVRVVFEGGTEAVRAAFHLYNSMADVHGLIEALREIDQA